MIVRIGKILARLGEYSFLLLFPGFFIYHSLVHISIIPSFLGGYFSLVSTILLLIYLMLYLTNFVKYGIRRDLLFFSLLFVIWLVVVSIYYFGSSQSISDYILYEWSLAAIISNMICFLIGLSLNLCTVKVAKKVIVSFFVMFFIVVFNLNSAWQFEFSNISVLDNYNITYQGYGRSILFTSLCAFVLASGFLRWLIFICAILILYFNGSRSDFMLFFFSINLYLIIKMFARFNFNKVKNLFGCVTIVFFYIFIYYFYFILSNSKGYNGKEVNRTLQLIDVVNSSSYKARQELQNYALDIIHNNVFFGDYGSYIKEYGRGGYAHNILSLWADFGIFIFFIYILSILYLFLYSLASLIVEYTNFSDTQYESNRFRYVSLLFLYSFCLLVAVVTVKDYSYMLLGLVLGLYLNIKLNIKNIS